MLTRDKLHALAAPTHIGTTFACGVAGVVMGAVGGFVRAHALNGRRDRRNRARRFRDVRRVTYGRLVSCCDSQTDALRSAVEDLQPVALESARALEPADEGIQELRAIVGEIEIVGGRQVCIQASKLLEAVCGGSSYSERLVATSSARKQFLVAADQDVALGRQVSPVS